MRTSNYRKFKITKKQAKLVGGAAAVAVLAGIIFFFAFFHILKDIPSADPVGTRS